jgi:tetratricopeptide (TPR) repeat protein
MNAYFSIAVLLSGFFLLMSPLLTFANNSQLTNAKVLLDEGEVDKAVEAMKVALESTAELSKKADIQGAIGWALVTESKYDDAEEYLKLSLKSALDSDNKSAALRANNNLGISNYLQNNLDESKAYFTQDLAQNSVIAQNYLNLISVKERKIKGEEALNMGVAERHNLNFVEAIRKYDLSLEYMPTNAKTLELKGYAQFRLGRFDEAQSTLLLAKKTDPQRKFIYLNLLKVACASDSSETIVRTIDTSGLDLATYKHWYDIDGEFRAVCADNDTLITLLELD